MRQAKTRFPAFERLSRISRWGEDRLTRLGRLAIALLIASGIFATDPTRTQATVLVAGLLALFAGAVLGILRWRPKLQVMRELPSVACVGLPLVYQLQVTNRSERVAADLEIRDRLQGRYPSRQEFAALRPFIAAHDNWFDRRIGFLSWVRAGRHLRGAEIAAGTLPTLAPGSQCTCDCSLTPLRRGSLQFSQVEFARPDPLNLLYALARIPAPQSLTVVPRQYPMPAFEIPKLSGFARENRTTGITVGGEEFHALREFRAGDPRRYIHWRVSAKRGIPVVKQFVDGHFQTVKVILDAYSAPVSFESLLEAAASVIATLSQRYVGELELVVLEPAFDPHARRLSHGSSRQHLERLAHLQPATLDAFSSASVKVSLEDGAAVVFLTSHWERTRQQFAAAIAARASAGLSLVVAPPAGASAPTVQWLDPATLADALAQLQFPALRHPRQMFANG